ncbi:hypothetical protein NMG60_11031176 [Bertholletia excelsa]
MALRRRYCSSGSPAWRWCMRDYMSSSSSSSVNSTSGGRVPLLWKGESGGDATDSQSGDGAGSLCTVQLLSWGRGASGQLGGGIEEIRLYPAPAASLLVPHFSLRLSLPIPGRLLEPSASSSESLVDFAISCGLFHSSLLVDGKLWIWGKGDGGRLGFGHENTAFVPTLNPNVDSVRSIALGGLHSIALNSLGQVFTWSVPLIRVRLCTIFHFDISLYFQLFCILILNPYLVLKIHIIWN